MSALTKRLPPWLVIFAFLISAIDIFDTSQVLASTANNSTTLISFSSVVR